jgi:restriction system protein
LRKEATLTVPTYDKFIEPVLRFLVEHPDGVSAKDAHDAAAGRLGLSETDRAQVLSTGQAVYKNRAGWAHDRLKRSGFSASPKHGIWKVTADGLAFASQNAPPLRDETINRLASSHINVPLASLTSGLISADSPPDLVEDDVQSPDDRLQAALYEIRSSVTSELLERLLLVSPKFFETVVLDVLHKLGYGTSRSDLQQVGGSGDGGVDGVISLDRLGLEKVYVQAKRWQATVGRPEIQGFYGALAGQRANKGVFITTSSFTAQAVQFAGSVERIVLVDGVKLAQLMMDHEVGVSSQSVKLPKIDSDYFDE